MNTAYEAEDSHGVLGWDKVDALAEALLALQGMVVTTQMSRPIPSLQESATL